MTESIILKKGQHLVFCDEEFEFFETIASRKIEAKLRAGLSIANYGFQVTSLEKETMSILAEVAFSRMMRLDDPYPDDLINNFFADFEIIGNTIDVKATRSKFPSISIPLEKAFKRHADYFVLMRQSSTTCFTFVGSIHKDELIQIDNISQPPGFTNKIYSSVNLTNLELKCIVKNQTLECE